MRARRLSHRVLNNTIKNWGLHCNKAKDYNWTKHDSNAMLMLEEEVKRQRHEEYLKQKAIEMNPYLDPDQPYHMT